MTRLRKLAVMSTAALLALSLMSGCTTAGEKKAESTKGNTPSTAKAEVTPVPIKMLATFSSIEKNEVTTAYLQKMEKENNAKVELEIAPSSNYNEKLQLMVAGGVYPDMVLFSSHTQDVLLNGVNNGIFIPLTKYINAAPNLMKYTYPAAFDAVKYKQDGDIYLIPRTTIARNDGYIVRKDWVDNVGLKLPDDSVMTMDEFSEMLKRFTENDPDKNGKKDTYGYCPVPASSGNVYAFMTQPFGLTGWQEYNEGAFKYLDPTFSKTKDNYKKALEYSATLWKKGYIHPDWPVMKGAGDQEAMEKGVVGAISGFAGHVQLRQDTVNKNFPNAKLTYITGVKGADGKFTGTTANPGIWGGWAVTKTAKDPEKCVKLIDWALADEPWEMAKDGIEGLTYKTENGKKVPTDKYATLKQGFWANQFARRNNDPSFFMELTVPEAQKKQVEGWIDTAMKTVLFSKDKGFKPAITKDPGYIDADKKRLQSVSRIILGDLAVDGYDKVLDEWYKNGGEEYIKQMNDYIKKAEGK